MNKVLAYIGEGGAEYGETSGYSDELSDSQMQTSAQNIPLQISQIQSLKGELKKDLQTEIQAQIQTATAPLGNVTGYLTIGASVISVISILLLIIIKSTLQSKMNRIMTLFNSQRDELGKVTDELKAAKNEIKTLKNRLETVELKAADVIKTAEIRQQNYIAPPVQIPKKTSPEDKFKDFVSDFNALAGIRGNDQRKRRDDFLVKYKVKGFNCKNYNERMNNPSLEPEFETSTNAANCEYWAYEFSSNRFAVLPNVKSYNENYHVARAMGFVFNSNFEEGNYSNISIVNPAVFDGTLQLVEKGELVLSE